MTSEHKYQPQIKPRTQTPLSMKSVSSEKAKKIEQSDVQQLCAAISFGKAGLCQVIEDSPEYKKSKEESPKLKINEKKGYQDNMHSHEKMNIKNHEEPSSPSIKEKSPTEEKKINKPFVKHYGKLAVPVSCQMIIDPYTFGNELSSPSVAQSSKAAPSLESPTYFKPEKNEAGSNSPTRNKRGSVISRRASTTLINDPFGNERCFRIKPVKTFQSSKQIPMINFKQIDQREMKSGDQRQEERTSNSPSSATNKGGARATKKRSLFATSQIEGTPKKRGESSAALAAIAELKQENTSSGTDKTRHDAPQTACLHIDLGRSKCSDDKADRIRARTGAQSPTSNKYKNPESVQEALKSKYTKNYHNFMARKGDRGVEFISHAEKKRVWVGEKGKFNKNAIMRWHHEIAKTDN